MNRPNANERLRKVLRRQHKAIATEATATVAQTGSLLYRRLATCWLGLARMRRWFSRAADCQSAIQPAASRRYGLARPGSWSQCSSIFGGGGFP